jgi:sugar lactone lactonase YvrE
VIRAGALLLALSAAADAPQTLFTAPAEHRLVEGIATDGSTVWLSSVLDRTILTRSGNDASRFVMPKGTLHPMGLAYDARRDWLWIATDCPELPGIARCDSGALVAIDRRGQLKAKLSPAKGFHPGDVSVGEGSVFVSDTLNGAVYRLLPDGRSFRALIAPGVARSAQGTALTPDGKRLIVADYGRGIASVDLATGVRTLLPMADGKPLRGVDGLVRVGDRYFTIYNASSPAALIAFRVTAAAIEADVVHRGPPLTDPTQLTVDGARLLVVADAGWPAATKGDATPREPAPIVAFGVP